LPEDFVLYAFGGAGPVHAVGFAHELGIRQIYVFPTSPVFSAFGAATADVVHSRIMTYNAVMPIDPSVLNARLDELESELRALMESEHFRPEQISFRRFVSMRFRRQTYGVEVPLPWDRVDERRIEELTRIFEAKYEDLYGAGAGFAQAGIEINTLRVDSVGQLTKPALTAEEGAGLDGGEARRTTRQAHFNGRFIDTTIFDYERLETHATVVGPSIVEAPLTTIVVPPGYQATVDAYRNLIITPRGEE
jgi:N-methylhydantoinase A